MELYRYILFDLDGTLTDSARGIYNSIDYALKHFQIELEDKSVLRAFIGPPLHESLKNILGFDDEKSSEAIRIYREYFGRQGMYENEVYPHIYATLDALKASGKVLAIATSKPEVFTKKILEHFGLAKYFDFVAAATLDKARDKKSDIIAYALVGLGVENRSEVLMVGDRHYDIEGATTNGIHSVGVTYGYGSRAELVEANATYIAESPLDLLEIVD